MNQKTISEFEALQNAVKYLQLSKFNLSLHVKEFEDKRKTTKLFFLQNDKTGESISPVLDYENMNHFILGLSRGIKLQF